MSTYCFYIPVFQNMCTSPCLKWHISILLRSEELFPHKYGV